MTDEDWRESAQSQYILETVEAERQRFAQLLHDTVIAQLNLILAQTSVYEQTIRGHPPTTMALSVLSALIRQLVYQTRDLEENMHSSILQTLGLEPALEAMAQQQTRATGLTITLNLQRLRSRLDTRVELVLFRLAQHVVEYAFRQADASRLTISLRIDDNQLQYALSHNGTVWTSAFIEAVNQNLHMIGATLDQHDAQLTIKLLLLPPINLTDREIDVLVFLMQGLSNKDIAERLVLSIRTVKFHLDNIYNKLGVKTRTEAVILALKMGWIQKNH